MRNKLMILAAGAILAIGAAVAGFIVVNKPSTVVLKSVVNVLEDTLEREELELLSDAFTGGSVAFSLDSVTDEDGYNYIEDSHFRGKLYTSKDALMLTDVDVQVSGNKFAGELYVSKDEAYITEEEVIDGSYGLKFKELVEDLDDSIFAPNSGTDYEIPEEVYDTITQALETVNENEKMVKDFQKLTEKLIKKVWKIAAETYEFEKENKEERINGEKVSVRLITMTIEDDTTADFIEALYDFISETDLIVDFLEKYEETFNSFIPGNGEITSIIDMYEDAIDKLGNQIDDVTDSIEGKFEPVKIKFSTAKLSAKLLKLEVEYDGETLFTLELGEKGIAKSDKVTFKAGEVTMSYSVKENSKEKLNVEFVGSSAYDSPYGEQENRVTLSLNIDKKSGKYQAKAETYESYFNYDGYKRESTDAYVAKGKYSKDSGAVTLTIDTLSNVYSYDGEEYEDVLKLKCSITVDPKDKMPKRNKDYKSIADITEDDIAEWIERIGELDF